MEAGLEQRPPVRQARPQAHHAALRAGCNLLCGALSPRDAACGSSQYTCRHAEEANAPDGRGSLNLQRGINRAVDDPESEARERASANRTQPGKLALNCCGGCEEDKLYHSPGRTAGLLEQLEPTKHHLTQSEPLADSLERRLPVVTQPRIHSILEHANSAYRPVEHAGQTGPANGQLRHVSAERSRSQHLCLGRLRSCAHRHHGCRRRSSGEKGCREPVHGGHYPFHATTHAGARASRRRCEGCKTLRCFVQLLDKCTECDRRASRSGVGLSRIGV
jgi:hypothetical protein